MRNKFIAILTFAALMLTACDDTTDNVGISLTNSLDNLQISTDTFMVSTRSIAADSVLSRSTLGYLGKIRDPETGGYITGNFMTQFHIQENYQFPDADKMANKEAGKIVADSCELRLYYDKFYGDSLAPMKLTAYEMSKPMSEANTYYSNFDPMRNGYVNANGLQVDKVYTLTDQQVSEKIRWDKSYTKNIKIKLNQPYTDKDGNRYKNYGTYILNQYYQHHGYFKNSMTFAQHVVPGFYFKHVSGLGAMAYIFRTQLNVYFSFIDKGKPHTGTASFYGTEEVLQTSTMENDRKTINELVSDEKNTYLKSPAGIFTEITVPVEEIYKGHEKDSINAAKIQLKRINDKVKTKFALDIPKTVLLIQKDSLYSFFEHKRVADYKTSFLATYDRANNSYTFNNIGSVIKVMKLKKNAGKLSKDWNKLVVIPVTTSYYTINQTQILTKVAHDMSLAGTKLVGGSNKQTLSVIYSHFK